MDHSFFSLRDLDDSADRIEYLHDLAFVDITDFDILQDSPDELECRFPGFLSLRGDRTLTVIFEIHLDAIVLLDTLDRLTSLSDDFAHLLFWHEDCEEKWCKWREL